MSKKEATAQQKLFIDEYLKLRRSNQKKTAMNAGYSKKSAEVQASQLLKNPRVRAYLDERESQLEKGLRKEFMFDALEARKVMFEIMNDEKQPSYPLSVSVLLYYMTFKLINLLLKCIFKLKLLIKIHYKEYFGRVIVEAPKS